MDSDRDRTEAKSGSLMLFMGAYELSSSSELNLKRFIVQQITLFLPNVADIG